MADVRRRRRRRRIAAVLVVGSGVWLIRSRRAGGDVPDAVPVRPPLPPRPASPPAAVPVAPAERAVPAAQVVAAANGRHGTADGNGHGPHSNGNGDGSSAVAAAVGSPYGPGSARSLPDGSPPGPEYTIKGNTGSKLFHPPSSPYFKRTKAEVWFRTPEDATAAGFTAWTPRKRAAKA